MSLSSLEDAHLQVNRITHYVHLYGIQMIEHISIVVIEVTHSVIIGGRALAQLLLIIHIALLHAQDGIQYICGVKRITYPFDIAQIILLSLLHFEMDVHIILAKRYHAVRDYHSITITQFRIFGDKIFLGLIIVLLYEFLAAEPAADISLLVNLLQHTLADESTLDLSFAQILITGDIDMVDLHLVLLLHLYIQDNLIWCTGILALYDIDYSILVSFVFIIACSQDLGSVQHIWGHLTVLYESQSLLQILTFTFLESVIVDL